METLTYEKDGKTHTFKEGDKVTFKQGMYFSNGQLHYDNGWSIYEIPSPPKQMLVLDDTELQKTEIIPYMPTPSASATQVGNNYGAYYGGKRSRRKSRKSKSRKSRK